MARRYRELEMEIRPKTFGDNLNHWFRTLGRTWRPLLVVSLAVHFPLALAMVAVAWMTGAAESFRLFLEPEPLRAMSDAEVLETLTPLMWAMGIWSILQVLAGVFVYLAAARVVAGDVAGVDLSRRDIFRHASSRTVVGVASVMVVLVATVVLIGIVALAGWALFSAGGANFLTVFLTTVAALTALVVMVWLGVSVSLASQVIAIEDAGPVIALGRSFSLVQGRWWITLGFLAVAGIIASAASQVASLALTPLFFASAFVPEALAVAFGVSVIVQGILLAATAAAYAVWYIDLRARLEPVVSEQLV